MNRRQFLSAAALPLLAPLGRTHGQPDQPANRAGAILVDTHVHCFAGSGDSPFPYHERAPYRPAEPATPQHLLKCMDAGGIRFAVIVHPEPYQDDHRYQEYCLTVGQGRFKGSCLLFADRPGSAERLPELARRLGIVTARIHAYAPDRLPPFGKPELRHLWKLAADHNVAMQLHFEPRYAEGFEPLIEEFKNTPVIIDHLGRPFQGTPEEHERIIRWSRYPNTVMKLSSLPAMENYPHRDIRPVIRRLVEAYGPDRMIYGGGFGADATGQSYRAAFQRAREMIHFLSEPDQAKILGQNAARLFGFPA